MVQEADAMRKSLELKEKQLIELEEKLNIREKVSIIISLFINVLLLPGSH